MNAAEVEFDRIFQEFLEAQRKCAWCGEEFTSADELVKHIVKEHTRKDSIE